MPGAAVSRWAVLALGLLASAAADAEPADFRLVDATGQAYSIASFPPDTVLAIYFGYTTCLRACPLALDNIAAPWTASAPREQRSALCSSTSTPSASIRST